MEEEDSRCLTLGRRRRSREPMPRRVAFYISPERLLSAIETGRHFHVDGITVNKTSQTVESAACGGALYIEDVFPLIDGGRFP